MPGTWSKFDAASNHLVFLQQCIFKVVIPISMLDISCSDEVN